MGASGRSHVARGVEREQRHALLHGSAPIITNTAVTGACGAAVAGSRRVTDSTVAVPLTEASSVWVMTSIRGERSMRSTRYCAWWLEGLAPDDDAHAACALAQVHRGLAGRVAAATTMTSWPRERSASVAIVAW